MKLRLIAPIALVAGGAAAQSADEPLVLSDVVVAAPGPSRTADELIGNATVLKRDEILANLSTTLGDTLDREPGVSSTYFGPGASRPVLRGLGANRVLVLTNGIGVIDVSAASPDHQVAADGIDAERIEILRGPAALAYGGQAIGGVVNVVDGLISEEIPDAPNLDAFGAYTTVDEGFQGALRGEAGFGPLVVDLSVSGRTAEDIDIPGFVESAQLRAAEEAEGGEEEGEEEESGTLGNSFVDTFNISGGASLVGDNGFFGVAVRYTEAEYGLPGGHGEEEGEEGGEGGEEEEEENPFIDLEQIRVDVRGGYNVALGPINRITGSLSYADYEHTEFEAPGEAGTLFETDGVEGRVEALNAPILGFEGEVGVQFRVVDFSAIGEEAFVTPTDISNVGVFVYQAREWDNGFNIEGGLRYDSVSYDNVEFGEEDFDLFSASIGAHQHLENGLFFGAQFSYTERAPSEVELFSDGPHLATLQFEVGDPTLENESAFNIEGTARYNLGMVELGASLFYSNFNDFIFLAPGVTIEDGEEVAVADGLPVFLYVQEDADFFGGELSAALGLGEVAGVDWTVETAVDWVNAEFDDGRDVPLLPPVTLRGGVTGQTGPFTAGAEVIWAGDQDDPGEGFLPTDSYTLVNLRGSVDLSTFGFGAEGTELFIEARNLGDEDARLSTSNIRDFAPLPGRNIRIGARVSL